MKDDSFKKVTESMLAREKKELLELETWLGMYGHTSPLSVTIAVRYHITHIQDQIKLTERILSNY